MAFSIPVRFASAFSAASDLAVFTPSFTPALNTAIAAGERVLWLLVVSADQNSSAIETSGAGWVKEGSAVNSTIVCGTLFTLETTTAFDAGAYPTVEITNGSAQQYSCALLAYKATSGSTFGRLTATGASSTSNGSSTNSNPSSVVNNSGASQDVTVIATRSGDAAVAATAAPAGYTYRSQRTGATNGASTDTADRQVTMASLAIEDPAPFTSLSEQWVCFTYGFYEIEAVGGLIKARSAGATWDEKPVKWWSGAAWITKPLKVFDGSSWVLS